MRVATKAYLLGRGGRIMLAPRIGGEWHGYWDGYGGKQNKKEGIKTCAVREAKQEASIFIDPKDLRKVAVVGTYRDDRPHFELHVFTTTEWEGRPSGSREMGVPRWFTRGCLPLHMRHGDRHWLPRVLEGQTFTTELFFEADGSLGKPPVFTPTNFE